MLYITRFGRCVARLRGESSATIPVGVVEPVVHFREFFVSTAGVRRRSTRERAMNELASARWRLRHSYGLYGYGLCSGGHMVTAHMVMAHMVMAYIVMAYMAMAYMVMAYVVVAIWLRPIWLWPTWLWPI